MFGAQLKTEDEKHHVKHPRIKALGYNSNFNKGSFATNFDTREYFETHIRQ